MTTKANKYRRQSKSSAQHESVAASSHVAEVADDLPDEVAASDEDTLALVQIQIDAAYDGWRLDRALASLQPQWSRSRLQQWIEAGQVLVNQQIKRGRDAVWQGDVIQIQPALAPDAHAYEPEAIELDIVYEDKSLLVINKQAGLVVHPAAGHWGGTLLNGLLAYDTSLAQLPRAGIVHRLDADTSGLMVVARSLEAQTDLTRQLQQRSVVREYWALVTGAVAPAGLIDAALSRDPRQPQRFRVSKAAGAKPARTHFRAVQVLNQHLPPISWVACRLDTGRTHQIRVHLESIGHPLVGDPVYRLGRPQAHGAEPPPWASFDRQALHACRLGLIHPVSGRPMQWFRAPPADMRGLMRSLKLGPATRPREVFE